MTPIVEKAVGKFVENMDSLKVVPDFGEQVLKSTLRLATNHLNLVNEVTKRARKSHLHQVPNKVAFYLYGGKENQNLHPALRVTLPRDAKGLNEQAAFKAEAARLKKEHFCKPLAEKILKFAQFTANDLPLAAAENKQLFTLIKDVILPELILNVYDTLRSQNMTNTFKLQISDQIKLLVQQMKNAREKESQTSKEATVPDESLKELNDVCVKALDPIMQWMPGMIASLLRLSDLKSSMGVSAASGIRSYVQSKSLGDILAPGTKSTTKSMNENAEKRDANANKKTSADQADQEESKATREIQASIHANVKELTVDGPIHKLKDCVSRCAKRCLIPSDEPGFKQTVKMIISIIAGFFERVLGLAFYPIEALIMVLSKAYLNWQTGHIGADAMHDIHETFVITATLDVMDQMIAAQELIQKQIEATKQVALVTPAKISPRTNPAVASAAPSSAVSIGIPAAPPRGFHLVD